MIENSHRQPVYPELARVARITGVVALQALILDDGSIGEVCVQHSTRPGLGFEEAAADALGQWRYEPALANGIPTEVLTQVVLFFDLE